MRENSHVSKQNPDVICFFSSLAFSLSISLGRDRKSRVLALMKRVNLRNPGDLDRRKGDPKTSPDNIANSSGVLISGGEEEALD